MAYRELTAARVAITGASSGIGRALAVALGEAGARLVIAGRRAPLLDELAGQLRARRIECIAAPGDITQPQVRAELLERALAALGGLDISVNDAGVGAIGRFAEADAHRLRHVMEVNFFALAELTRQALPLLAAGRQPMIVNLGSVLGHRGVPRHAEYCASKFAVRGLTEALRAECAPRGIDVLLVSPGTTETEFFDHLLEDRGGVPWAKPRGVPPEVVARKIVAAMRRGAREIVPSWPGWWMLLLNRCLPGVLDRVLARYG